MRATAGPLLQQRPLTGCTLSGCFTVRHRETGAPEKTKIFEFIMSAAPFHVVLVEPEIPPNTGNVARLCAATGARLHLVEPLGFDLDDKTLRRAGMDYWELVCWKKWKSLEELFQTEKPARFFLCTTKAKASCFDVQFAYGDFLLFGRETRGLPESLLARYPDRCMAVPMFNPRARSLNLATAVAVVLYEAIRQNLQAGLGSCED